MPGTDMPGTGMPGTDEAVTREVVLDARLEQSMTTERVEVGRVRSGV
jgi:hypothetical protein